MHATTTSLAHRPSGDGTVAFVDRSCGRCDACTTGGPLWCIAPVTPGRDLGLEAPAGLAEGVLEALLAASAAREALSSGREPHPVLITGPAAPVIAALLGDTEVLVGESSDRAIRTELAGRHESGRAGLVVATADLRAAVKAVRRGGTVVGTPGATLPSVTEVVQREVAVVVARSVRGMVEEVTGTRWRNAVAAATETGADS